MDEKFINMSGGRLIAQKVDSEIDKEIQNAMIAAKERGFFNGATPVRGVDYWTEEDKAEIKQYVDDAILNGEW